MKRRILLVDDEVAVLLTLKAVLEISGFDVDTAASAREGKSKLKLRQYEMVITDMRMESDQAGRQVIIAARTAPYRPAVALLTAFPVADEDWEEVGADKMLVKPMQTRMLIQQVEKLLTHHQSNLKKDGGSGASSEGGKNQSAKTPASKTTSAEKTVAKKAATAKTPGRKFAGNKTSGKKTAGKKTARKMAAKRSATAVQM